MQTQYSRKKALFSGDPPLVLAVGVRRKIEIVHLMQLRKEVASFNILLNTLYKFKV